LWQPKYEDRRPILGSGLAPSNLAPRRPRQHAGTLQCPAEFLAVATHRRLTMVPRAWSCQLRFVELRSCAPADRLLVPADDANQGLDQGRGVAARVRAQSARAATSLSLPSTGNHGGPFVREWILCLVSYSRHLLF